MQLIVADTYADLATWQEAFETSREAHAAAGLSLLQMWRDADRADTSWLLFEVADEAKARAFLDGGEARVFATQAGLTERTAHFVETA